MLFRLRQLLRHLNHSKTSTASISQGVARPITVMSHDTNKACCTIPPVSSNYEPKGKYLEPGYGFNKTYVVGPDNSQTAVVCELISLEIPISLSLRSLHQPLPEQLYHQLAKALRKVLFTFSTELLTVTLRCLRHLRLLAPDHPRCRHYIVPAQCQGDHARLL